MLCMDRSVRNERSLNFLSTIVRRVESNRLLYEQSHISIRLNSELHTAFISSPTMPHLLGPSLSLPDDVLYSKLLEVASQQGDRIIVDDRSRNTQFGYLDILNGIATLKQQLLELIDPVILAKPGDFFVALLAPNGYEFIVGVLATLAIGGVVVPVREFSPITTRSPRLQQLTLFEPKKAIGALPAEISHIIRHCHAQILLIGPEEHSLALEIAAQVPNITSLAIQSQASYPASLPPVTWYTLHANLTLPEDTPSILFFTSGTTGPPKGVLHARRTINKYAHAISLDASNDEICLIPRGTFWSIYFTKLFQMLLLGVRVEIQNFGRNYDLIWEKFRQNSATKIVLSPTFWFGMMVHYKTHIATLEDEGERAEYVDGFRYLRDVYVTGAMPSAGLKEFWRELRGGRPLKVLYGTTETQEIAVAGEDEYSKEVC
jgi:malonyl-CoA/methylmalonyl-CoA synthetase